MTLKTTLKAATALALLLPAAAQAENYTGSMEFTLGLGSSFEAEYDEAPAGFPSKIEGDTSALLAITPGIDRMLGKSVGIGLEMGFVWLGTGDDAGDDDVRRRR